MTRLPKLSGADIELGNFILGPDRWGSGSAAEASRALLEEINGLPYSGMDRGAAWQSTAWSGGRDRPGCVDQGWWRAEPAGSASSRDWGRKFLAGNGGCVYIDLDHLELCLPEVISAWDHVAAWLAMLRIAGAALSSANRKQPPGRRIQVLVNNSDGREHSYGSHLNFLITRRAWDNLFDRKVHQALFLAAWQAASVVFTGQGKVGSENGAEPVPYQLSQRADFVETLFGVQTTCRRPLVNSRDEPLCGRSAAAAESPARLHVIFFDSNLAQVAGLLKVGVMQIVLAMIEAGQVNARLLLDDPLDAVIRFSHDPTLKARAKLVSGMNVTAVELQFLFLEEAAPFVEAGGCDRIVPRAREILALWEDTLKKLRAGDLAALAPRLDWVLKLAILERAMHQRPGLDWDSPQIKHLDHLYSSLDPAEGLFWAYERAGLVERVVTEADIERLVRHPPEDTRAWTRAMLLRRAGALAEEVDWDSIRFKIPRGYWSNHRTVALSNPLAFSRTAAEQFFEAPGDLDDLLDELETAPAPHNGIPQVPVHQPEKGDGMNVSLGRR